MNFEARTLKERVDKGLEAFLGGANFLLLFFEAHLHDMENQKPCLMLFNTSTREFNLLRS